MKDVKEKPVRNRVKAVHLTYKPGNEIDKVLQAAYWKILDLSQTKLGKGDFIKQLKILDPLLGDDPINKAIWLLEVTAVNETAGAVHYDLKTVHADKRLKNVPQETTIAVRMYEEANKMEVLRRAEYIAEGKDPKADIRYKAIRFRGMIEAYQDPTTGAYPRRIAYETLVDWGQLNHLLPQESREVARSLFTFLLQSNKDLLKSKGGWVMPTPISVKDIQEIDQFGNNVIRIDFVKLTTGLRMVLDSFSNIRVVDR